MNKINTKSIVLSLEILAILAFGFISLPTNVSADTPGYVTPYNSTSYSNNPVQNNNYVVPNYSTAPIIYSNNPNENTNTSQTNSTNTSTTTSTNTKSTENSNYITDSNTENRTNNENYSDLAATAVYGSNSFLPSGLIQWVLFGIIILLIVILVRKIFGGRENYDELPMKYS